MGWEDSAGWDKADWKAAEWKQEWQETDAKTSEDKAWGDSAWDDSTTEATQPTAWDTADASAANATAGDAGWGATPAAGSWGAAAESKGAGPAPANAYWEFQKWYKDTNVLSRKEEWEHEKEDNELFVERLGSNAGLAFDKYEHVPVEVSGEKADQIPVTRTFEELYEKFGGTCIPNALIDNVRRCRYKTPTPVQKYAIPAGLAGRDIMCCAQTGSGKTAAFLFPVIGRMMLHHKEPVGALTAPYEGAATPDSLVITPTRELCMQIYEEATKFCHRTDYRVVRIFGGEKPKEQFAELAKGCDVMVATPGRLQDFIDRSVVEVAKVQVLVLDEADRMLDMGFEPAIRAIVQNHGMPQKDCRQTMMFSATFPEECQKMAQDFLFSYLWIGVGVVGGAVDTVEQRVEKVAPNQKYAKLVELLDDFFQNKKPADRCLVFVNAKDTAKWLDEQLYEKNFDTGALHGNLDQTERTRNMMRFRKGEIEVMIATDVAARGLDIEQVVMVINYDMPNDIDAYIHRIGRTGRIGNQGTAVTFISCDEEHGTSLEHSETLKKLLQVMQDSRATIPDWLEGSIQDVSAARGGWTWGNDKDVRPGQENYKSNGAGDEWSNWKGSGDTQQWSSSSW